MASTLDGDKDKEKYLETKDVQLSTNKGHYIEPTPCDTTNVVPHSQQSPPKLAKGGSVPSGQALARCQAFDGKGAKKDSFTGERHVLHIKSGDQEWNNISCSISGTMNQSSDWIKCIHHGSDLAETSFQHYLVYSLVPDSTMSTVLEDVADRTKDRNLLGLILVHHLDSIVLDNFWDTNPPSNFLLCVVSRRLGQPFLDRLQNQKPGEVSVAVDLGSSVDVPDATVKKCSSFEAAEAMQSSGWWSLSLFGDNSGFSLSHRLKPLLDEASRGSVEVAAVYGHVFSHFRSFEKDESRTDMDKGFFLLRERLHSRNFVHECFLHLAIVYRALSLPVYKDNNECSLYLSEFIAKMRDLLHHPEQLAAEFVNFLSKKDFEVADLSTQDVSFFAMMRSASQHLLNDFKNTHPVGHLGLKMLFVYVDLVFNYARKEPEDPAGKWRRFIEAEKYYKVQINQEELKNISDAIDFGIKVHLPPGMRFTGIDLADMMVHRSEQHHFTELMNLMNAMTGTLFKDQIYLVHFLGHSHGYCFETGKVARDCLCNAASTKDITKAMKKGVKFLSAAVCCFGDCSSSETETSIIDTLCLWWGSMIDAALVSHPDAMCIALKKLNLKLKDGGPLLMSRIKTGLNDLFDAKFEEDMKDMTLRQFAVYVKSLPNIRIKLVMEYLEGYSAEKYLVESSPSSGDLGRLLEIFFERWPKCESVYHKVFVNAVMARGDHFKTPNTFIPALLTLQTVHLLSDKNVTEKSSTCLLEPRRTLEKYVATFIKRHKLAGAHAAQFFMDAVKKRDTFTPLQQVVLSALTKYVCLQKGHLSKLPHGQDVPQFKLLHLVLDKLVAQYKVPGTSWGTQLTVPIAWYWEILCNTCKLVKPEVESLDLSWCHEGKAAVLLLTKVCNKVVRVTKSGSLQSVSDTVKQCTDDRIRAYFQWIEDIQNFIHLWQQKVLRGCWTENEIRAYCDTAIALNDIARSVHIVTSVISKEEVTRMMMEMQSLKLVVKSKLIQTDSDGRRCSILGILYEYNVVLPQVVLKPLNDTIPDFENCFLKAIDIKEEDMDFKSIQMRDLKELGENLHVFLLPIVPLITFLVHFSVHKSHLFSRCLRNRLQQPSAPKVSAAVFRESVASSLYTDIENDLSQPCQTSTLEHCEDTMGRFQQAVKDTKTFLKSILLGEATYGSLCSLGCFQEGARALDVTNEFRILQTFQFHGVDQCYDIRFILQLIQCADYIANIKGVCERYQLSGCLRDKEMETLLAIHSILESEEGKSQLNAVASEQYLAKIWQILHLTEKNWHALGIFAVVKESSDFHQFLLEKKFRGMEGASFFMQQHTLITSHLQHEEYNELVLNQLLVAFRYMSPFLDTEQDLSHLMKEVYRNCGQQAIKGDSTDFVQLRTVNKNVHLVRLWFSRAEGDTLENVAEDLKSLLNTGHFIFIIPECMDETMPHVPAVPVCKKEGEQRRLLLHYQPSAHVQGQAAINSGAPAKLVIWSREQIEDFTRKLGFLEKNSEDGIRFQQLSAIAQRAFALQCELVHLGYPQVIRKTLKCSEIEEAKALVNTLEEKVSKWSQELKQLRTDYDKLLFFHIPKMLRLLKMLHHYSSVLDNVPQLVQEVNFLFDSTVDTRKRLTTSLQCLLAKPQEAQSLSPFSEKTQLLIAQLGMILNALFQDGNVQNHAFPKRTSPSLMKTPVQKEHRCVLHVAPELKPKDLIRLIFELYKGIPAPYEVYRCRADSTEEELFLFFQRTVKFPYLQFSILEVNMLPPKLQEVLLQLHLSMEKQEYRCTMHYIATGPCVLEDMPWVTVEEHKPALLKYDWKQTCAECELLLNPNHTTFAAFELVYGRAGDGKTHYIRKKMMSARGRQLTVIINESFSAVSVIQQLRSLPMKSSHNVLYFSFTLLPPSEESSEVDRQLYHSIMAEVQCFFFDLFFLGYVEDPNSGLSFKMPSELKWACYFEVPSQEEDEVGVKSLQMFGEELPVLKLVGKSKRIQADHPFEVDSDVQLVCKYLHAYHMKGDPVHGINRLYEQHQVRMKPKTTQLQQQTAVRFEHLRDLPVDHCHELLTEYMPKEVAINKMYQKLFIRYMKRRCKFLEQFPGLNYNAGKVKVKGTAEVVDTSQLGSTIMETMLKEVRDFCNPVKRNNWSDSTRQQLVYDVRDGGGCFHLIAVNTDNMSKEEVEKYRVMGTELPTTSKLATREYLDKYLASAFNLPLENGKLKAIDEHQYVLTLDYTLKMLEIHERFECGIPVIIEGETGVGKTALVEMLSILWNQSLLGDWRLLRDRVLELLKRMCYSIQAPEDVMASYMQLLNNIQENTPVLLEDLEKVCSLSHVIISADGSSKSEGMFHEVLASYVQQISTSPVVTLLDFETVWKERAPVEGEDARKYPDRDFPAMMEHFRTTQSSQATAGLLFYLLRAQPIRTFYKLNVHAALTPKDFSDFFLPIFKQGSDLKDKWAATGSTMPKVTVFLDEINTSSCMGLLKEVLVDRTFFGQPIQSNIFIIAACNPHRGNSVILLEKSRPSESWVRGSYNVHRLHPTIRYLKWDYGALGSEQEEQYIKAKMEMIAHDVNPTHTGHLSILIVQSQELMRSFAADHLKETYGARSQEPAVAKLAHSCVSQRDIQRVFTLYQWLYHGYTKYGKKRFNDKELADSCQLQERAVMVALGIVYYFRLDENFRNRYKTELKKNLMSHRTVEDVLKDELVFYSKHFSIPHGIAKTQALLENLFCIIACCCTKTPLIIVGAPGSSKTLSFNLALANIKGAEAKSDLFGDCELFPIMDPHFYQCSRRTTSVEVETVFLRAIKRQASFNEVQIPISCVVFMDEAGLPEESHESLKVLHKYLDSREVSFVAITNHLLDAAKTNRAVSLFRARYNLVDIQTLAQECFESANPKDAEIVRSLCEPFSSRMSNDKWFKHFFGLRDFIHMLHYMHRKKTSITPQLVMAALERNFNGCEHFKAICTQFLKPLESTPKEVRQRSVIEILQKSLQDKPNRSLQGDQETYDEVRYKLVIDPSEDDSLSRLLLMYKILEPKTTKTFVCSDFPEDSQLQKISTIAAIRHAAVEGQTVLMSQTDDIHESFYDLFNQHFRRIDDPDPNKEPRFYANIAIGSHHKPCRVHRDFQCVVIVRKSELPNTPAPFLNRFEKYCISHKDFLDARLLSLQPCLRVVMECAVEKVHEFFNLVGDSSFYGAQKDGSIDSLALSILPSPEFKTKLTQEAGTTMLQHAEVVMEKQVENGPVILLTTLINTLQKDAGFHFMKLSAVEVQEDAAHIFGQLSSLPSDVKGVALAILENRHSREQLVSFVRSAVHHLHLAPPPEACKTDLGYSSLKDNSEETCVVVMVMVQWLVLYMSKRLLQLMKVEALTLFRKRIPQWCLESYLTHQSHFSLKEVITSKLQHTSLHSTSSIGMVPTKLMCYTRSTPNIHRLPAVYPTQLSATDHGLSHEAVMKEMITDELAPLYLCKLSNVRSQQAFLVHLQSFTQNEEKRIMLLVINMQETSKQMVNHIRIMIEQAEGSATGLQKLFVLLLHFPPSMFYNPCYPALFLNGWDHHYLDSVQPEPEGIVDIRLWFDIAYQHKSHPYGQDVIVKAVQAMIPSSVSVVSSRVSIGSKKGGLFNSTPTDGSDKVRRFERLLTGPVGEGLCRMYARYWQPAVMARYLEEAALYSKDHKSTVSFTDSMRDFFQAAFHNFLAYMVHRINEDLNIDIIFEKDCEEATHDLFIQLMKLLPKLPRLAEVKAYNNTWTTQQERITTPSFPFFRRVAKIIDELLEMSMEEMQKMKKPLTEASIDADIDSMSSFGDPYHKALISTLERQLAANLDNGENPLLKAAVTAIGEHDALWQRYWKDFLANQFHLNAGEDKLTFELINFTLARPLARKDVKMKLVILHCMARTNQINLTKLMSGLRPLQMLQTAVETTLVPTISPVSPMTTLMSMVDQDKKNVDNPVVLYQFIIDTLFGALAEEIMYCKLEKLHVWRECYRDVTSQPSVKQILFHPPSREESYIGRLNTMAAVFLLLQVRAELDEKIAFDLGKKLMEQYFPKDLQMSGTCPRLREIVKSLEDIIEHNPDRLSRTDVTAYLENLLAFFFSPLFTELNDNDVIWFLGYVNKLTLVDIFQEVPKIHQDADLVSKVAREGPHPVKDQPPLLNAITTAMAKRLLGEILTHAQGDSNPISPLGIFYRKARRMVAQELLQRDSVEGKVGHYLPLVYRQYPDIATGPSNPRMEQPLADIYFLVAMEHMVGGTANTRLETALEKITEINDALKCNSHNPEEMVLLHIELQAVVQMVLWKAAQSVVDPKLKHSALSQRAGIIDVIQDPSTQGGKKGRHELVFMMHLLKQLNGPNGLLDFINTGVTGDLTFLAPYKTQLTTTSKKQVHLFPFMLPDAMSPLANMYRRVTRLMEAAGTDEQNTKAKTALVNGLMDMSRLERVKGETGNDVDTKLFLKMAVWLVVYYEFYSTGKKCPFLISVIQNQSQLDFTAAQLQLMECFLNPKQMVKIPEIPFSWDASEENLEVKEVPPDHMEDPIYALFNPPEGSDNPSDVQLRHALANLIALTFSLPPRSTHLWYFLFDQSELEDTYLPGFMYPTKVAPNKMLYDCGVLLNEEGQFGRPDYHDHNSPLSLHSFYLLEWATFGVLCMALLIDEKAKERIHGHIISSWRPLRHFCLEQLRRIWLFMRCNLQLGDEERSFLIVQAMQQLFEHGQSDLMLGKFVSQEAVRRYEQQWHSLYETCTHDLEEKLKKHSQLLKVKLVKELSVISTIYPQFPTERQFRHSLESLLSSSDPSRSKHFILAQFLDDRERLAVGSALLPDLVEMYLWLDTHVAHLLLYEPALKMTAKYVIEKASERYSSEAKHIHELYERLTKNFNNYVRLNGDVVGTGGCVREHVTKITDSTPVIRLLSTDNNREGGKNDWLCLVMKDIISAHNNLVQLVASQSRGSPFACWLQSAPLKVEVREFSIAEALFSKSPELRSDARLLSMIRSRYLPMIPEDSPASMAVVNPLRSSAIFDLDKLESDVVRCFIAGKPLIKDVDVTLRRPFRFRDNKVDPSTIATGLAGPGCPVDLAALSQELPKSWKDELPVDKRKGLEADFHSASYNVLSELVTGLRTAAGYLYQTLQQEGEAVLEQTLVQFLCYYFGKEQPSSDLLKTIELKEFTAEQLCVLETLQVRYLYKTLEMFVGWINDCLYDFYELPFTFKRPLPASMCRCFEEKLATKSASLEMLTNLEDTVSHIAQGLHKDSIKPSQPLRENLVTTGFYSEKDAALQLVPEGVLLHHYMHFVVLLRKWKLQLQTSCSARADTANPSQQVWVEVVPDVWEKLPHFQDKTLFSTEDMKTALKIKDEERYSSEDQDLSRIWLEDKESMDSFEDLTGEDGGATDFSAAVGQTEGEDEQPEKEQHSPSPSPMPSKQDSQPSLEQSIPASLLAREPSEKAMAMTTEEVVEWLGTIKLSKYAKIFQDEDVDGELLATYNVKNLEEIGVNSGADGKKILLRFRRI